MGALTQIFTAGLLGGGSFWPQDWNGTTARTPAVDVNQDTALGVMAYYAGVRVLSEDVASLPLIVYRRLEKGGKERAPEHPLYSLLHDRPNPEMSSFTWRETSMSHLIGWGNCYSEKEFDGGGRVIGLWPLRPDRMTVARNDAGKVVYRYRLPGGERVELPAKNVFHVRGLGYDGLVGYSPIELMRRALALSMAAEQYGERTFENDARPGVVLIHPKTLSDKARENLEKGYLRRHEGLSNAQRAAVLEEGVTLTTVGFPPEQTQFLESRKFQVREVARGLRLQPHKIGDLEQATFSNIEQQSIDYVTDSLRPWLVRWEQQMGLDLIPEPEAFAEFLVDGLLRGDTLSRTQALWIRRQAGVVNADEWREIENQNPLPDGKGEGYWQPLNVITIAPDGTRQEVTLASNGSKNGHAPEVLV